VWFHAHANNEVAMYSLLGQVITTLRLRPGMVTYESMNYDTKRKRERIVMNWWSMDCDGMFSDNERR